MSSSGLKRKADSQENAPGQPRTKLPAIAEADTNVPLRPSRTAANRAAVGKGPPPLTKPKAPPLSTSTTRRYERATSAPPKIAPVRPPARPTSARPTATRPTTTRTTRAASGSAATQDKRFQALQDQVQSIESARAADTARLAADMERERAKLSELEENHMALTRELAAARTQEMTHKRELVDASDEMEQMRKRHAREMDELEAQMRRRDREIRELKDELRVCLDDLERERQTVSTLKSTIAHQSDAQLSLTTQVAAMKAQIDALQGQLSTSSVSNSTLVLQLETERKRVAELERETLEAETIRRKLHNMVQELKGNIRVFCRVRPILPSDLTPAALVKSSSSASSLSTTPTPEPEDAERLKGEAMAQIVFPDKMDHKEIVLHSSSESATGQERKDEWTFSFDRVFEPHSTQMEVFEEISQLVQSCTDGYNVCVFAYGQTGSGKSFTMEGGHTDATVGMIPRAVDQVFKVTDDLRRKGWEYKMEGQFLEIYNETINDLLGKGEFDKKKHEIKHDARTGRTTVTDVNVVALRSPAQVRTLLAQAQSRRTVAATLMNERSSRSHSVFTLRIRGENAQTREVCEGSLNLVDLAGSERLEKSGAAGDKDRLRETQNINRSLSALGDVIAALGEKGEGKSDKHIPYRNSKLTYLLQNSLSGNSKTLMVLNLSPLATHLNESLCSLRFATKVNNTTIGTAKKQSRPAITA
ncbi:kinesin-domain-containing protein [Obba rivulosa]|uniref:Kinesin-like protein n=1 Tax=Obba rivulosa TaxID=1052685 RepID=A0A8E2DV27_9APHY|nr:kinesin-domain-containing protein [Obba rivulosa]